MKRILLTAAAIGALFVLALGWASPALAEECKYHVIKGSTTLMSEPLDGYDVCYSGTVRGTLKGRFITCFSYADFYTSDSLWADTNFVYWIAKGDSFLETSKGEIFFEERGVYDVATELAAGMDEVTGGTGSYEGATGVLQFRNKWPNRLDLFVYEGQICTP